MDLLLALNELGGEASLSSLAERAGIPKPTAHRLLKALHGRGLVSRGDEGGYRLGLALVALGESARRLDPLARAARTPLQAAAQETGESVFVVSAREERLEVRAVASGSSFLRAAPDVGAVVPLHASAAGRLYLAFAPDEVAPATGRLRRFTAHTPASAAELSRRVERARERGWDANVEEWMSDVAVLAVPVFACGELVACVAIATSSSRFERVGSSALITAAKRASVEIAAALGGPS